jgi:zinc finger SWIM domain-containing protein 3
MHDFCRDPVELFNDSGNPYVDSEITAEHQQGIDNPIVFWDDIIKGVGQEFDNVKDFRAQLCKYAIGKEFAYRFIKNETTRVTEMCCGGMPLEITCI